MAKKRKRKSSGSLELHKIAHYAFLAGIFIALLSGLFTNYLNQNALFSSLVILGIVVGAINLTVKETMPFLIAAIAIILAGVFNFGLIPTIGDVLETAIMNVGVFVSPGALIVGIKTVWKLASD